MEEIISYGHFGLAVDDVRAAQLVIDSGGLDYQSIVELFARVNRAIAGYQIELTFDICRFGKEGRRCILY
jgi:hypothetical protein